MSDMTWRKRPDLPPKAGRYLVVDPVDNNEILIDGYTRKLGFEADWLDNKVQYWTYLPELPK